MSLIETIQAGIAGGAFDNCTPQSAERLRAALDWAEAKQAEVVATQAAAVEAQQAADSKQAEAEQAQREYSQAVADLQAAADALEIIPVPAPEPEAAPPPTLICPVKSMMAKIGKLLGIPFSWDGPADDVTFASSNAAVCGVTKDGTLIPMKAGIAVITIAAANGQKVVFAVTVTA